MSRNYLLMLAVVIVSAGGCFSKQDRRQELMDRRTYLRRSTEQHGQALSDLSDRGSDNSAQRAQWQHNEKHARRQLAEVEKELSELE